MNILFIFYVMVTLFMIIEKPLSRSLDNDVLSEKDKDVVAYKILVAFFEGLFWPITISVSVIKGFLKTRKNHW